MYRYLPVVIGVALLPALVLAAPKGTASKSKAAASKGCPYETARCAGCPEHTKKAVTVKQPSTTKTSGTATTSTAARTVRLRCEDGKVRVIDVAKATKSGSYADYKGKRYYFGCPDCLPAFKKDPAGYAKKHPGFPIPQSGKAKAAR